MHEFNVCQSIVDTVIDRVSPSRLHTPQVMKVSVVIGALRPLLSENMRLAYATLIKDTIAEGSHLHIKRLKARGKCSRCGALCEIAEMHFICRKCGGKSGEIVGGRELYIEHIEIQEQIPEGSMEGHYVN